MVWFLVGILWFVVQFGISEIAYQASIYTDHEEISQSLGDLSDAAAWPAGWIYDYIQKSSFESQTRSFLAKTDPLQHETRKRILSLLDQYHDDFTDYDLQSEIYTILSEADPAIAAILYLDESSTYFIYISVCLGWSALIATTGFLVSVAAIFILIPPPKPDTP